MPAHHGRSHIAQIGKWVALRTIAVHDPELTVSAHSKNFSCCPRHRSHVWYLSGCDLPSLGWICVCTLPNAGRYGPLNRRDLLSIVCGVNLSAPIGQVICDSPSLAM